MAASPPYQLAFSLHGHASDVRHLSCPNSGVPLLLSASRDGSAIVWGPSTKGKEWDVKMRVEGPEKRFVSCVGMVRHESEAFLLVGSSSGILSTFMLPSATSPSSPVNGSMPEPLHTLIEHKQNLCCMDTSKRGLIATGSWDKSVIVWKKFKRVLKIEVHDQAVWAVRFVGEDRILTGENGTALQESADSGLRSPAAADKKIILHAIDVASGKSNALQEYSGHAEPVRGLSLRTDGKGFWSCGNDGLINFYSFDHSTPIRSLSGHTSFVYSVAALPDGSGAISSGEDGTVRIWSETELIQTIPHTSNSLWSCAVVPMPSGSGHYIASSANDTTIRFFTRSEELMASAQERAEWDKEVGGRQLDKSQVGDVKHSDLPGMEALGREGEGRPLLELVADKKPGKKDGQVLMIKNNGVVEAYQWSGPTQTWQQIGQVVDAIGSNRKQLYEGQEYDYVFDVDVSEGMPPLKLPYNVTENPWIAAQKFLNKNELPETYADQVVEFIEKNTEGVKLGQGGESSTYVDPYTGTSRYTAASNTNGFSSGGADPFTGSSAYSSTPAVLPPRGKGVLPVKTYLSFKQFNVNAARSKIAQLNDEAALALTTDDEKNFSEIYALLSQPAVTLPDANKQDAGERYDPLALLGAMSRWPEAQRFPLIDIARSLSAISPAFGAVPSAPEALLRACDWDAPWASTKARETNTLLALRALANLFLTTNGRRTMGGSGTGDILTGLRKGHSGAKLGSRTVPLATIALNYSITAVANQFPVIHTAALLELVLHVLESELGDSETIYRASVALGNLLVSASVSGSLQVGSVQRGKELVGQRASALREKRLVDLAEEISALG